MFRPRSRRRGLTAVASIVTFGLIAPNSVAAAPTDLTAADPAPTRAEVKPRTVTLITGDRVTLRGPGGSRATIQPGEGRSAVTFGTYRSGNHLYVVPSDVSARVAKGTLDRRLFDVTALAEAGYGDELPLIVTYNGKAQQTRRTIPGATLARQLPVINGAALVVGKESSVLTQPDIEKIWLDGTRKVTLDRSVPQIGAPAAWTSGYTGKGVPVAVLDTGVDASHPDLATQVAGSRNFTESPGGDHFGHGTHVASTIAGTAAASAGKYKGVAPEATLYDGKVCDDFGGCQESAILAGMEWAATEVKAKVVNLSLGGTDTPEIDPLEEAVNRLTAETGALFVIAAGNSGPGERTVGSPGSADAALTVGAVDKQDQLAGFSSRGPRVGDNAVKPDITAPGVAIVAARAKDSIIGIPVGDDYLNLDGTSMATPHVAGAAAILAQQHPDWTAAELKGALMASARPAADQTAFEQGAGRVDVAKGIKQTVIAESGNISFGTAQWPHDDDAPVTKTVTYRNLGDQPVTLGLAASLNGPDGAAAPATALELSASTVTIPAGGTATVQATSNTNHDGPDGPYSGRLTATADGVSVTSALAVEKEAEAYTLALKSIGRDGKPIPFEGSIFGLERNFFEFLGSDSDTLTLRLPKGEYLVHNVQYMLEPNNSVTTYGLVQPSVKLAASTTVVFDARTAKQVKVSVPQAGAQAALADIGFDRISADGRYRLTYSGLSFGLDVVYTAQVGSAALPAEQLLGHVSTQWAKPNANGSFDNSPYYTGQLDTFPGRFPTGFVRAVKAKDQAVVRQAVHAAGDRAHERTVFGFAPGMDAVWGRRLGYGKAPLTTTLYVDGQPATWQTVVAQIVPGTDPHYPVPQTVSQLTSLDNSYRPGKSYDERYYAAALGAGAGRAVRLENILYVPVESLGDADGHAGFVLPDSGSSRLIRDGKVIAEATGFGYVEASGLPAVKSTYTLETTQTQSKLPFATRTDLRWTFSSAAAEDRTELSMPSVRYQPPVDSRNLAARKPVTVLPIVIDAAAGKIRKLTVEVSGDDGKTWRKAAVAPIGNGRYKAIFPTPKGSAISLRSHLVDGGGNVTDVTVIRSYGMR